MKFAKEFLLFFKNNNLISTIIATIVSTYVTELTQSFADDIIIPIINRDGNEDGEADIKTLETFKITIFGIKFKVGKFIITLIKVIFIFFIVFIINKYSSINND